MLNTQWAAMPIREQELDVDRMGCAVGKGERGKVPGCVAVGEFVGVERHKLRYVVVEVGMAANIRVRADSDPGGARARIGTDRVYGQDFIGGPLGGSWAGWRKGRPGRHRWS